MLVVWNQKALKLFQHYHGRQARSDGGPEASVLRQVGRYYWSFKRRRGDCSYKQYFTYLNYDHRIQSMIYTANCIEAPEGLLESHKDAWCDAERGVRAPADGQDRHRQEIVPEAGAQY